MSNLPKTYKAAVIVGQQKPLEIQELPMPEVKEGEILLKVLACGVCHSDHHVLNGDMGPPYVIKCTEF
jgi:D-arabinose 1-dehydrogenase-like Zn-dependent alcohol dehydrogenase